VASTDRVTGLANRHVFDARIINEWEASHRGGASLGLLMIDVDHFKVFNDQHGHLAGDECLRKVAAAIDRAVVRPGDLACRYGGDEFAVIMPDTDEVGVERIAETMRANVAATNFTQRRSKAENSITVSIGAATMIPTVTQTPGNLVKAADAALFRAKERGRNQVVLESTGGPAAGKTVDPMESRVEKVRFKVVDGNIVFGPDVVEVRAHGKQFTGAILDVSAGRVAQNIGRGTVVLHDETRLDRVPAVGEAVCVMYQQGRGHVVELLVSRDRDHPSVDSSCVGRAGDLG
jgi:diguanylate cyclase (GGDEF)-like protein